jgi:hypothetical protein
MRFGSTAHHKTTCTAPPSATKILKNNRLWTDTSLAPAVATSRFMLLRHREAANRSAIRIRADGG